MIRKILAVVCLTLFLMPLRGQEQSSADSLYVFRFVAEKEMFYIPWKGNDIELERLCSLVQQHKQAILDGTVPICVNGYCYLPRNPEQALRLARVRSLRLKSELILREQLTEACFVTHNYAGKWQERTHVVTVSLRIPWVKEEVPAPMTGETTSAATTAKEIESRASEKQEASPIIKQEKEDKQDKQALPQHNYAFALRANLLRWATLTPDLGVEWRVNRHTGILLNGSWTSWSWDDKNRRMSLWKVSPEVRYYIGKEKRGFLGAMYHIGEFNYKLGRTGKQGDYQGGGITGGYLLPMGKALALDFHAGVGYTRANYDKYSVENGVRVQQGSRDKNYWGINQLGITLVWKIIK
ncbi:MAG: DUF3575 domain-containing protein [Bacteroides sp.]